MLAVAERSGNAGLIGRASWQIGFMLLETEPAKARPYLERALRSEADLPPWLTALIRTLLALCLQSLGYLDQALGTLRQAEQSIAQGGIGPWALAACHNNAAGVYAWLGDGVASLRHGDAAESLAEKYGVGDMAYLARSWRALALALSGRREEVLSLVRASAGSHPSRRSRMKTMELFFLGEACVEAGLIEDGLGVVETLQSTAQGRGGTETPVSRISDVLNGMLLLRCDPPDLKTAEDCLRRSIERYRAMDDRLTELRCATDLARVLRDTGRREEARAMLAEIYNWFTEGLDTRYLKEAKALLES